jgi:hypothetical protein
MESLQQPTPPTRKIWPILVAIAVMVVGGYAMYRHKIAGGAAQATPETAAIQQQNQSQDQTAAVGTVGAKQATAEEGKATEATEGKTEVKEGQTHATVTGHVGTPAINTASAVHEIQQKQVEQVAPGCYKISYHHKPLSSHNDGEACLHHKNLIVINQAELNPKTVCIRVNGAPVKYEKVKGHPDQFVIAAIAGPKAEITARFCTGKLVCKEECKIRKDEFLSAIGGEDDSNAGGWEDNAPVREEVELDKEMKDFDRELAAEGRGKEGIFKDWISAGEPARACESRTVASAGGR